MAVKKLVGLLLLAGSGLAFAAVRWSQHAPAGSEWATAAIEWGTLTESISASAVIQPREVVPVGCDSVGRVIQVHADVLQNVQTGDPLIQLDDRMARLRIRQASIVVELAQADVSRAEAARDLAKVIMQRAKEPVTPVSLREADQAESQLKTAEAAVTAAHIKVREAQTALQLAELGRDLMVVRSPIRGIVLERKVVAGQQIGPPISGHLFTIAPDLDRVHAIAQVSECDIPKLRVNQTASFTVNAYPDHVFEGRVARIAPVSSTVQGAVFFTVTIEAANQRESATNDWRLKPGMPASVDLIHRQHANVWKLPVAAGSVALADADLTEPARTKLRRWKTRGDRAEWQRVWVVGTDQKPWPLFLRVGGRSSAGDTGIPDGQFQEILAWDPEEKAPSPSDGPVRVIIAAAQGAEPKKSGLKFF